MIKYNTKTYKETLERLRTTKALPEELRDNYTTYLETSYASLGMCEVLDTIIATIRHNLIACEIIKHLHKDELAASETFIADVKSMLSGLVVTEPHGVKTLFLAESLLAVSIRSLDKVYGREVVSNIVLNMLNTSETLDKPTLTVVKK